MERHGGRSRSTKRDRGRQGGHIAIRRGYFDGKGIFRRCIRPVQHADRVEDRPVGHLDPWGNEDKSCIRLYSHAASTTVEAELGAGCRWRQNRNDIAGYR
ncbi:MAG: hypothetical protein BWX80_03007 [Candidatus Hydrogenedentes bacterium ADurb.Bin101]|nr:MAG: hypothetical protein BWX80_03007 [Candidatus Hydrogenedentes bacterium ADurb.Bin101]